MKKVFTRICTLALLTATSVTFAGDTGADAAGAAIQVGGSAGAGAGAAASAAGAAGAAGAAAAAAAGSIGVGAAAAAAGVAAAAAAGVAVASSTEKDTGTKVSTDGEGSIKVYLTKAKINDQNAVNKAFADAVADYEKSGKDCDDACMDAIIAALAIEGVSADVIAAAADNSDYQGDAATAANTAVTAAQEATSSGTAKPPTSFVAVKKDSVDPGRITYTVTVVNSSPF